jgi:membrane associated rhomboid family serine protease
MGTLFAGFCLESRPLHAFGENALPRGHRFANNALMGYEDRDYYRDRPRLEFSGAMGRGTLTLMIIIGAGFFAAVVLSNTLSFTDERWLNLVFVGDEEGAGGARLAYAGFVLTGRDVAPWVNAYTLQPWKVLTSWLVEPSLFVMVMSLLGAYFVGRAMEDLLGTKRLLLAVFALSVISALLASLVDPVLVPRRLSIIMGMQAALLGLMTPLCWLYPKDQLILSFPARKFIAVLIIILLVVNVLLALTSSESVILSPTQPTFAVLAAAGFTQFLSMKGRLPRLGGEADDRASWGKPMYRPDEEGEPKKRGIGSFFSRREEPEAEEDDRAAEKAEKQKVDALLEKISKKGIDSLSRAEREFLDNQSKRMKK